MSEQEQTRQGSVTLERPGSAGKVIRVHVTEFVQPQIVHDGVVTRASHDTLTDAGDRALAEFRRLIAEVDGPPKAEADADGPGTEA